ncbi:MAG TPA: ABC transporter permease [Bryobacteraceae bacterium]|nr:ABC transporter permease [Bryobacteraceae bacterium]
MFLQDLRYGLRRLAKSPGFTVVAILTLALGIGANTAIFSVVNGVLISPLPFRNANRIVSLFQDMPDFPQGSISYPNFLDWQRDNRSFESMAAYRWANGTLTGAGVPENVPARSISAAFFPILGVNPILGRNFNAEDDRRGADPTVLISEGLWQRKFGSNPDVIGKRLVVGGTGRTIVGVIPASFRLKIWNFRTADLYVPIGEEHDERFFKRDAHWGTDAIALLRPGVTPDRAREDLARVNAGLAATYPDVNTGLKCTIVTLKEEIVGEMRLVLLVLLGAIGFVLMIACVNVANLLLARSASRQREFAIRVALGAGQARITIQLLTESVVLAVLGGGLGLAIAKWGTAAAVSAVPRTLPRAEEIGLDGRVLLFTFAVSILAGILFGLAPALKSGSGKIGESLKAGGRSISGYRSRTQAALVIGEMAMAFVLLIGAGLMARTLLELWRVDPGFDPHHVVTFDIHSAPSLTDQSPDAIRALIRQMRSSMQGIPGAEHVSIENGAQLMQSDNETGFWVEGQTPPARRVDLPLALEYWVEPEYLKVMRIPLLRGRFITDTDDEHSARVVVIDSSLAQKYFPGQDPIGKHVNIPDYNTDPSHRSYVPLLVVGVVGHVNQFGLADDSKSSLHAQIYLPFMQTSDVGMKNVAFGISVFARYRPSLNAESFFQTMRNQLLASNRELIVSGNQSEEEIVSQSIASQRFSVILLGIFAALALLLASIGIYGVLSYLVAQRTQEIGLRMALGARQVDVLRMVLADGAGMMLVGIAIGVLAALGLTRWMSSMLFGVTATDPLTFATVAAVLWGIGLCACYVPVHRAMRVDPILALRQE